MGVRGAARGAALVLLFGAAWLVTPAIPWLDDAFISLHSAQSVLAGGDASYGSPPLTGVTSPPYVLLLITLLAAGLPPLIALKAGSALALVALAFALWGLGRALQLRSWRQFVPPVVGMAMGQVLEQATNGVETGWAMALAVALVAATAAGRPIAVTAAAALLPWLRPDLFPMAAVLVVAALWRQPRAIQARALLVGALVFLPWPVWLYSDTAQWIPQTMAAKGAFFAESCRPFPVKVTAAGAGFGSWVLLLLPVSAFGFVVSGMSPIGRLLLGSVAVSLLAYVFALPGGLWHNYHRYLYPIAVPALAFGVADSLRRTQFPWRAASIAVTAATVAMSPFLRLPDRGEAAERLAAAQWVRERVDPGAILLVQDAGVFSVETPNRLVDLVGLKTPPSAAEHARATLPTCGAGRAAAIASIARSSGADYLVLSSTWDAIFSISSGLRDEGVGLELMRSPSNSPYDGYDIYRLAF